MDELRELYQQVILDHNRQPRNFREMEHADASMEGYNPLCGDHYTFYFKFDDDIITDISFVGSGCAISKASASIMTAAMIGKSRAEAERLFQLFHSMVTGRVKPDAHLEELGKLAAFAGVSEFPARVKCATLPWHTMQGILEGGAGRISTEESRQ